jgi:hypothetical protein
MEDSTSTFVIIGARFVPRITTLIKAKMVVLIERGNTGESSLINPDVAVNQGSKQTICVIPVSPQSSPGLWFSLDRRSMSLSLG